MEMISHFCLKLYDNRRRPVCGKEEVLLLNALYTTVLLQEIVVGFVVEIDDGTQRLIDLAIIADFLTCDRFRPGLDSISMP